MIDTAERAAADIRAGAEAHAQRELEEARRQIDAMTRDRVAMVSQLTEALIEHATLVATQCEGLIRTLEATMRRLGAPAPQRRPAACRPPRGPAQQAAAPAARHRLPGAAAAAPPGLRAAPPSRPAAARHGPAAPARPRRSHGNHAGPGRAAAFAAPQPETPPAEPVRPRHPSPAGRAAAAARAPAAPRPSPCPPPRRLPRPASSAAAPAPPSPVAGGVPDDAYLRATRLALDGRDRSEIAAQLSAEFGIADPEPVLNRVLGAASLPSGAALR